MSKYKSYHTVLKQLIKNNKLPGEHINDINRSTLWRWRHEESDKYIGYE